MNNYEYECQCRVLGLNSPLEEVCGLCAEKEKVIENIAWQCRLIADRVTDLSYESLANRMDGWGLHDMTLLAEHLSNITECVEVTDVV